MIGQNLNRRKNMKEYKTLRADPEEADKLIPHQEVFGWKLENTQEIYSENQEITGMVGGTISSGQSSYVYGGGANSTGSSATNMTVLSRTNVKHFISMRFSRETTMPNYAELKDLEKQYEKLDKEYNECVTYFPVNKPIRITIGGIIVAAVCAFLTGGGLSAAEYESCIFLVPVALSVGLIVLMWKRYKKKKQEADAKTIAGQKRRTELSVALSEVFVKAGTITKSMNK